MRAEGKSLREISKVVRRSKGTVSKELKRNKEPLFREARLSALEKAKLANDKAKSRQKEKRRGKRKALRDPKTLEYIANKLCTNRWTPEIIANVMAKELPKDSCVSASTIYRIIKHERKDLISYLPLKGKTPRQRVSCARSAFSTAKAAPKKVPISQRAANTREEMLHVEVDIVKSTKKDKCAVLTIICRATRVYWTIKVENLLAITIQKALIKWLLEHPKCKSMTFDNGSEFADWHLVRNKFPDIQFYFCDAYASYQKGSNERCNRNLRLFLPKGTTFSKVLTDERMAEIEHLLQTRPLKMFNYQTPEEVLSQFECNSIAG